MNFTPLRWLQKGMSTVQDWYLRNGFPILARGHDDYGGTWSGESVTETSALNHSVVWACRRIISESVAMLPLELKQDTGDGKFPAPDKTMFHALKYAPNSEMCALSMREAMTGHAVMTGNAYGRIVRRSGSNEAIEFWPLLPTQVRIDREKEGQKRLVHVVKDGGAAEKTYTMKPGEPPDIFHMPGLSNDGICGYSVVGMAAQSIGVALAGERHVGNFFRRGGRLPYNLRLTQPFKNKTDSDKFRADWEELYAQPHRAPILEPWVEYQQTGMNLKDSQMLESRQFTVQEICRWFQVSPHLVADLSHATFSNIENLAQQFVTFTLYGWLKRWEENLWRCVLTPKEQEQGYYFQHNLNALQRGNFQARMAGYSTALQNGFMSQNEVRNLEDLNPFEGGDDYHIQLNMQTLPGGEPTASQQAALTKIGTSAKGFHRETQNGFNPTVRH